jgi:hypothetical protein
MRSSGQRIGGNWRPFNCRLGGVPLETRSMYDATTLGTAVWAAIHEPRGSQVQIIKELLDAGASPKDVDYPTGHSEVDAILGAR